MKIVVFSDMHGNSYAFEAFMKILQTIEYDKIVFCGDVFGYYYDQAYILEQLMQIKNLIWLKGNHDAYFVNLYRGMADEKQYIEKYGHSYQCLRKRYSNEMVQFIEELPESAEMVLEGKKTGIFHGTPSDYLMGRLYPNTPIEDEAAYEKYDLVLLGHTHFKMERHIKDTWIINPGSLGQPRDGKGYGYAVIDLMSNTVSFNNVVFDTKDLYKKIDYYDPMLCKLKEVLERKDLT